MEILETRVYRGPNTYALWPMIRLQLDLGELENHPTAELPGFTDRLVELIPTLADHTCGLGVSGGFIRRMREDRGTWLGHVLEHIAIELQCLAGTPVSFGKTRQGKLPRGRYHVVYSYLEEPVGLEAGRLALSVIRHLLPPERPAHDPSPFDYAAELDRLVQLAKSCALDPTTAALVRAAERRDIPWIRLDGRSLVQLGHGRHQRHIHESLTSEARQIAVEIASDRQLTHRVLEGLGLPVQEAPAAGQEEHSLLVVDGKLIAAAQSTGSDRPAGIDRTDDVHEDNRHLAELAVQAVGLGVGGVGFVSPDIARSYKEVGGAITGIQASPSLGLYLAAAEGRRPRRARDVAGPILDMLFPKGAPAAIPISSVAGGDRCGKTTVARMVGHILTQAGHAVGMATSDGVSIDGNLSLPGDMTGPQASQLVLRDPRVDAAVLETSCESLEGSGLGWERCGVAAVLSAETDEIATLLRTTVEVAWDCCVLNADDPRVAALAEHTSADPIYVTRNVRNELVRRHVRERGKAVVQEEGISGPRLVLYEGDVQTQILRARQIPATQSATSAENIQNAMFAAAIACGLGVAVEDIREGLRTFMADTNIAAMADLKPAPSIVDFLSHLQRRGEEARKEPVPQAVPEECFVQVRRAG